MGALARLRKYCKKSVAGQLAATYGSAIKFELDVAVYNLLVTSMRAGICTRLPRPSSLNIPKHQEIRPIIHTASFNGVVRKIISPNPRKTSRKQDSQNHDIVVDNLEATVDSHRRRLDGHRKAILAHNKNQIKVTKGHVIGGVAGRKDGYGGENTSCGQELDQAKDRTGHENSLVPGAVAKPTDPKSKAPKPTDIITSQGRLRRHLAREGDYEGKVVGVTEHWAIEKNSTAERPYEFWVDQESSTKDGMSQLNGEIESFVNSLEFEDVESQAIDICMDDLMFLVGQKLPRYKTHRPGSYVANLAIPGISGIDVCIYSPEMEQAKNNRGPSLSHPRIKKALKATLHEFAAALAGQTTQFQKVHALPEARLPMLSASHRPTGMRFRMRFDYPVTLFNDYTAMYLNEHSDLRPTYLILKMALRIRNLDYLYEGGIDPYTLLVMILIAIRHSPAIPAENPLAHRLMQVLYFWASADTTNVGYAADPPRTFDKFDLEQELSPFDLPNDPACRDGIRTITEGNLRRRSSSARKQPYLLCLQDPAEPAKAVGGDCYQIRHVQATFARMHKEIEASLKERDGTGPGFEQEEEDGDRVRAVLSSVVGGADWSKLRELRLSIKEKTAKESKLRAEPGWRRDAIEAKNVEVLPKRLPESFDHLDDAVLQESSVEQSRVIYEESTEKHEPKS